jgi:RNA polymerase sigma factor (TIGR02999 family)
MGTNKGSPEPGIEDEPETAAGDQSPASGVLFSALYSELHRLARRELQQRGGFATLSPTTVIHEAYLVISGRPGLAFPDQARFMGYAARVMRGIVVDHARSRSAQKRGGRVAFTTLRTDVVEQAAVQDHVLIRIADLLDVLAATDAPLAELVDLKFFCGFSVGEISALRGVSERTVQRDWEKARAYLRRHIGLPAGD